MLAASQLLAFADTYLGSYNLSTSDPTYGPYTGAIWASNISNHINAQYVQAGNWSIAWNSTPASNVRSNWVNVATVFHVFAGTSGTCAAPFSYDGAFRSSQGASAWVYKKNATCFGGSTAYYNEARVYWPASQVQSGTSYYGAAEFVLQNGDLWEHNTDHVSNDIYFVNGTSTKKDNISNRTWCFDGTNNHLWGC